MKTLDALEWYEGEIIHVSEDTTISIGTHTGTFTVPRVTFIIDSKIVLNFNTNFKFHNGVNVKLEEDAKLTINKNVTFGPDSHIHAETGYISISGYKSLTLESNSTLYLHSYPISTLSICNLIGKNARIVAPIKAIFDSGVEVSGNWATEYCYPQWFGAVAYNSLGEARTSTNVCSADAFTKALSSFSGGIVVVPRGFYRIAKTVKVPNGVKLRGVSSVEQDGAHGSVLVADFGDSNNIQNMIVVNQKSDGSDDWQQRYPRMGAEISNLYLVNMNDYKLRAIMSYDSVRLDNVIFGGFFQAIKYSSENYLDSKHVTNCTYYFSKDFVSQTFLDGIEENDKLYAFDMGFLGDSLLFEHNAIHSGKFNKGLKINCSGGASINANIINADVFIKDSKAVDFSANHLEGAHVVEISCSEVTSRSNYYWIGTEPTIQIVGNGNKDESIVTLENDVFRTYTPEAVAEKEESVKQYSTEAEISLDQYSRLNLINTYRYRAGTEFGKIYTTGVKICKPIETNDEYKFEPFTEFNNYSYALSQNAQIASSYKIKTPFEVVFVPEQTPMLGMINSGVYWTEKAGTYEYRYQILTDKLRHLGWPEDAPRQMSFWDTGSEFSVTINEVITTVVENTFYKGVLFNVQSSMQGLLRLIRKCQDTGKEVYADIPVCGASFLYDNGISIQGYPWKEYSSDIEINKLTHPKREEIFGENAKIWATSMPAESELTTGDIVFNMGTDASWNIKIKK